MPKQFNITPQLTRKDENQGTETSQPQTLSVRSRSLSKNREAGSCLISSRNCSSVRHQVRSSVDQEAPQTPTRDPSVPSPQTPTRDPSVPSPQTPTRDPSVPSPQTPTRDPSLPSTCTLRHCAAAPQEQAASLSQPLALCAMQAIQLPLRPLRGPPTDRVAAVGACIKGPGIRCSMSANTSK